MVIVDESPSHQVSVVLDVLVELSQLLQLQHGQPDRREEQEEEGVDAPLHTHEDGRIVNDEGGQGVGRDVGQGQ